MSDAGTGLGASRKLADIKDLNAEQLLFLLRMLDTDREMSIQLREKALEALKKLEKY